MSLRRRFLDGLCDHQHQYPLLLRVLVVMGVFLGFPIVYFGTESFQHPIIVLDAIVIGAGIVFFSAAIRICARRG